MRLDHDVVDHAIQTKEERNSDDLEYLVQKIKEKNLNCKTRTKKIKVLTISPVSWSREKIAKEFGVTEYMAKVAIQLRQKSGILAQPTVKKGRPLPQETVEAVKSFYLDDSNSYMRVLPGKNDFISVGYKKHEQKRLILCNLDELYSAFQKAHPDVKIGFSSFPALRPKQCITVGASGTHSVCVCTYHQNVELMHKSVDLGKSVHELTDMIVCSRENKNCMLHGCDKCPGVEPLKKFMIEVFATQYEDSITGTLMSEHSDKDIQSFIDDTEIQYSKWTSTDRSDLIQVVSSLRDFIETFCTKLFELKSHSFIAKQQNAHLNKIKENLKVNEAIAILDFAENFSFVVQDEAQGFHWNNKQCSLHPVTIYYKNENKTEEKSCCVVSDDLTHDVDFVHEVIKITCKNVQTITNNNVEKIFYFSDGCAQQYKNCKNFVNLCNHKSEFDIDAEWNFFATSHGKNTCDAIGGCVKRAVCRESLQRPYKNQILTTQSLFDFCCKKLSKITFELVSKEYLEEKRITALIRYDLAKTVPGTRGFHCFTPQNDANMTLHCKRISMDDNIALAHNFISKGKAAANVTNVSPGSYVLCQYDSGLWVGVVQTVCKDQGDCDVKFLHPQFPAQSYFWPFNDNICSIPLCKVLSHVNLNTPTGRHYMIEDSESLAKKFSK